MSYEQDINQKYDALMHEMHKPLSEEVLSTLETQSFEDLSAQLVAHLNHVKQIAENPSISGLHAIYNIRSNEHKMHVPEIIGILVSEVSPEFSQDAYSDDARLVLNAIHGEMEFRNDPSATVMGQYLQDTDDVDSKAQRLLDKSEELVGYRAWALDR